MNKILINSVLYAIILNVIISFAIDFIASEKEKNPPNGANKLTFKEQIIHMFVHHKQVVFASSILVAIVVAFSIGLAQKIPILR